MSRRRTAQVARVGALVGALVLAAPTALPAHAASAPERAAASCNGLTASVVGSPNGTLIGTAGDDVIVTKGATRVDSGAGNDSICVTGKGTAVVNAGPGDDFVGARTHKGKSFVSLGFGDDVFYGGEGNDRVWSQEASNQSSTDDTDLIDTGGGDDYVISGSSTAFNSDQITLGPGDDGLVTYGLSSGASLSGGLGTNTYQPLPGPDVAGDWVFDNVTGQAAMDEIARLVWSSFQHFVLTGLHGPSVKFLGSRANEWVVAGGTCRVVMRGREGADRLTVDADGCNNLPAGDGRLLGGPGHDQLKGSDGDDVLIGGAGRDTADGGLGTNRCEAEEPVAC